MPTDTAEQTIRLNKEARARERMRSPAPGTLDNSAPSVPSDSYFWPPLIAPPEREERPIHECVACSDGPGWRNRYQNNPVTPPRQDLILILGCRYKVSLLPGKDCPYQPPEKLGECIHSDSYSGKCTRAQSSARCIEPDIDLHPSDSFDHPNLG